VVPLLTGEKLMYSVIQPIEVLDDNDEMLSTWMVLATDINTTVAGNVWIITNVEEDLAEHTLVIKTSAILKFEPDVLKYLVLGYDELEEARDDLIAVVDEAHDDLIALLEAATRFPSL
jgi:hypothetical protein